LVLLLLARGDTAAPSGLSSILCHAFLVFFILELFGTKRNLQEKIIWGIIVAGQ